MTIFPAPARLLPLGLALAAAWPAAQAQSQGAVPTQAEQTTTLDTIKVTARRREESAQDVPAPISTLGGNELEAGRTYQVQDLQQLVPSLNANFVHARQSSLAIRGIGNNLANEGLEGSVGVYVDNVYLGRPGAAVFDLLDLEQIDVLRGPQGTLFGKNTTAGVLNITTRKPTFEPDNTIEVSAGNRGYYQLRAAFSGPLSETLAGRLSLSKTHDDGWIKNINDGRRLDSIDRDGIRGQLLWQPHGRFSLRLIGEYNSSDDTQGASVITGLGPVKAGYRTLSQAAALAGAAPLVSDWRAYQTTLDGPPSSATRQTGLSAEAEWKLPSGHTLTSISALRNWKFNPHNDVDLSTASAVADLGYTVESRQASQKLRLASPTGGAFDYVVGGYWFWQDVKNTYTTIGGSQADLFLLPTTVPLGYGFLNGIDSQSHGAVRTNSIALFGQGNWHIDPRWDITTGLRGTYEEKKAQVSRDAPTGGSVLPTFPAPYAALNAIRPGQYAAWSSGPLSQDNFGPSALLGTSYKLQPEVLAYASLSHGEKSGGFNVNGVGSGPSLGVNSLVVGPERANNLELGIKSTLWDRKLLLNANAYYARVSGYQAVALVTPAGTTVPVQVLSNVGEIESKGFEWQV
ncbi:TonB-dependent receptor [Xylophilus sp.]|uniref:TonB-dependent receptor n=1 Tax=Xylophilus sp. TaxID=2653893 RepID=UPI0013B5E15F|nr:TonB-dependent receptor [Xylophilus sp.]KAF1046988.1 MAG: Pesticin receptor [Xylophilus sp.]